MDAGGHPQDGDADVAVALLEEKVKDRDAEVMLVLGVCCEFGMGTEQDVLSSCTSVERRKEMQQKSGDGTRRAVQPDHLLGTGTGSSFQLKSGCHQPPPSPFSTNIHTTTRLEMNTMASADWQRKRGHQRLYKVEYGSVLGLAQCFTVI